MDHAHILRDVAIDGQVHVLAPRKAAAAEAAPPAAHDERAELAYQRGLAEGRAMAAHLAREEIERMQGTMAERVREEVASTLVGLREAAQHEGREAGRAQAHTELDEARAAMTARVEALVTNIATRADDWMRAAEDELVLLVHEATCRLVAEAAVRPEAIRLLVQRLLGELGEQPELLHVHVHPNDFSVFAADSEPASARWRWVPDASVALGGACLRSPRGSFDARLETQFTALADVLRQARARRDGVVA